MDTAVCVLTFGSGAIATIDNSRRAVYGYDQRIEVFGSGGMVAAGNVTPDSHVVSNANGIRSAVPHYFFLERYADAYAHELIGFVEAVKTGTATPVTGHDGRMAVVIATAHSGPSGWRVLSGPPKLFDPRYRKWTHISMGVAIPYRIGI